MAFASPRGRWPCAGQGRTPSTWATDRGPAFTRSGYAREVALWPRGTAFAEAPVLHEASEESVRAYARRLEDDDGTILDLLVEVPSFFEAHFWRWDGAAKTPLSLLSTARLHGLLAGQLIVELRRPRTAEGRCRRSHRGHAPCGPKRIPLSWARPPCYLRRPKAGRWKTWPWERVGYGSMCLMRGSAPWKA